MSVSSGEGAPAKPLDSLPKVFVDSMRTLFDIMDDKRTGFVHYSGKAVCLVELHFSLLFPSAVFIVVEVHHTMAVSRGVFLCQFLP